MYKKRLCITLRKKDMFLRNEQKVPPSGETAHMGQRKI
jgi:hypothetical protein